MKQGWKVLGQKELFSAGFFELRSERCELPDGRVMPAYYILDFPEWANIIPITKDRQLVLVEQYRHAGQDHFLEVPGGTTHPGMNEDPEIAASRELLEETGYQAGRIEKVASHYPNPALQNNQMHTYIAWDCEKVQEPHLDPFEDLRVLLMPFPEVIERLMRGEFTHSIISNSLFLALSKLVTEEEWLQLYRIHSKSK